MCYRTLLLLVQTRVNPGGLHKPCAHKDPDIKRVHFYSTTDKEKNLPFQSYYLSSHINVDLLEEIKAMH